MRTSGFSRLALGGLLLVVAAGCAGRQRPGPDATVEERLRFGYYQLERGSTYSARQVFEELIFSAPGSAVIDSAHYGLGEAYFLEDNFIQAQSEYDVVVRNFPRSPLVDDAAFKSALCWWEQSLGYKLDQNETRQAIDAFRAFLLDYPTSDRYEEVLDILDQAQDRLALKKIYEGDTYRKLGTERDLQAAALSYLEAIRSWPDASVLDRALWGLGLVYLEMDALPQALEAFGQLVAVFPDSERAEDARARIRELTARGVTAPGVPPPVASGD